MRGRSARLAAIGRAIAAAMLLLFVVADAALAAERPELRIVIHDIAADPSARLALHALARRHGLQAVGVPAFHLRGVLVIGFDAARKEYVDLVEAGIIDPTKVLRVALENAVSAASLLLLTEATLTEIEEEKPRLSPSPGLD